MSPSWSDLEATVLAEASQTALSAVWPSRSWVSLFAIAQQFGIDRIEEREIPSTALLVKKADGKFTVVLKSGSPITRTRFSIAHEIAHLILAPYIGGRLHVWHRANPRQDRNALMIEHLCDRMAATILMPEGLFAPWMATQGWTGLALPHACDTFGVSFEAAARRFIDVFPGQVAFLKWSPSNSSDEHIQGEPTANGSPPMIWAQIQRPEGQSHWPLAQACLQGKSLTSQEIVRFHRRQSERILATTVETVPQGRGQWRQVYFFLYPNQEPPPERGARGARY